MRSLLVLGAVLLLSVPAFAKKRKDLPPPDADADVKIATERFDTDIKSKEQKKRLAIVKWYGQYKHKTVLKRLKKVWLKDKDLELQAAAAEGLGKQTPFPRAAGIALIQGLEAKKDTASRNLPEDEEKVQQELEVRVLVNGLTALRKLGYKPDGRSWKLLRALIDHPHDEVSVAMFTWCGATKEWRSIPRINLWFMFYKDGYSWSGGSVKVDTGAAGGKDAAKAKAKFNAMFGTRPKKARPEAHLAMRKALEEITGSKFTTYEELKAWMKKNKALLKKNGA